MHQTKPSCLILRVWPLRILRTLKNTNPKFSKKQVVLIIKKNAVKAIGSGSRGTYIITRKANY